LKHKQNFLKYGLLIQK